MAPPFWQKFMSDFIAKTLGEFIADFDEKTFQLHDFNKVDLKNVKLRDDCLNKLNLPVRLKSGMIGSLILNWTFSTGTVRIVLKDVYIICARFDEFDDEEYRSVSLRQREQTLADADKAEAISRESEERQADGEMKGGRFLDQYLNFDQRLKSTRRGALNAQRGTHRTRLQRRATTASHASRATCSCGLGRVRVRRHR